MPAALVIEHVLDIAAPPALVWAVIIDLPRYGEWNPFVVCCRSSLVVGDPIDMRVRLFAFAQPQRETILEHVPGQRLCYGIERTRVGALASRRSHEVGPNGVGGARYRSYFELSGWLAGTVRLLLGTRLRAGFTAMSRAIQQRAESLASP